MSRTQDTSYIVGFSEVVHHEFRQMTSKLYPYVTVRTLEGNSDAIEGLSGVEAKELNGRFQKVVFDDISHTRRQLARKRYGTFLGVDANDARAMLMNQSTEYAKSIVAAMQRVIDRIIYNAAFADVRTGENFADTLTFADDGGLTVDATAGLTYEKMLETTKNFIDNDVDVDNNEFVFCGTGDENDALMKETELTSGDYSRHYVTDKGFTTRAGMFDLKWFAANAKEPVIKLNTAGERRCLAMVKGGIILGIGKLVDIEVATRPDLAETKQVSAIMSIGAVRRQGKVVQEVLTTP